MNKPTLVFIVMGIEQRTREDGYGFGPFGVLWSDGEGSQDFLMGRPSTLGRFESWFDRA